MNNTFLLEQVANLLQNSPTRKTRVSLHWTGCLTWLTTLVYPPRNPGKGPLPGPLGRVDYVIVNFCSGSVFVSMLSIAVVKKVENCTVPVV
jgi:hypothetical protein